MDKKLKRKVVLSAIFNSRNIGLVIPLTVAIFTMVSSIMDNNSAMILTGSCLFIFILWAIITNTKDQYKIGSSIMDEFIAEESLKESAHELKILPEYFNEVISHNKQFELRKDDRDYKVGDYILLKEYENGEYTGRESGCLKITYILRNCPEYGLMDGYCILGW